LPDAIRDEIRLRRYQGGHMIYLRPESRRALADDAGQIYPAPIHAPPIHTAPIHAACGAATPPR
jgi:hypothetical protein